MLSPATRTATVTTLGLATLLGACLQHPLEPVEYNKTENIRESLKLDSNRDVDILFVIDNSGSQGIDGCGYESPLEAMRLAITKARASNGNGFIRPEALLSVVLVTDEADCCSNPAHKEIFASSRPSTSASPPAAPPATRTAPAPRSRRCVSARSPRRRARIRGRAPIGGHRSAPLTMRAFSAAPRIIVIRPRRPDVHP